MTSKYFHKVVLLMFTHKVDWLFIEFTGDVPKVIPCNKNASFYYSSSYFLKIKLNTRQEITVFKIFDF